MKRKKVPLDFFAVLKTAEEAARVRNEALQKTMVVTKKQLDWRATI